MRPGRTPSKPPEALKHAWADCGRVCVCHAEVGSLGKLALKSLTKDMLADIPASKGSSAKVQVGHGFFPVIFWAARSSGSLAPRSPGANLLPRISVRQGTFRISPFIPSKPISYPMPYEHCDCESGGRAARSSQPPTPLLS